MLEPYKKKTALFFFLTFLGVLAWTASPIIIANIVTQLGKVPTVDGAIWFFVGIYAVLRFLDEVFWRFAEFLMRSYKPNMIEGIRTNLFAAALKRPYAYFVNSSSGRVGHWINQAVTTTNELVDTTLWTVWPRIVGLVISSVFLFIAHWSLALLFIVWLVILFWYNVGRGRKFGKMVALQSDETSKASGMVVDSVSNHLSVRVFGAAQREQAMLLAQQKVIIQRWKASWWQNLITNTVKGQSAAVVSIIALIQVVFLYSHGVVHLGDVVLFIAYFGEASGSLWQLAWALDSYFRQFGTIQNSLDGLQGEDERQVAAKHSAPATVALGLVGVGFAYPEQPDAAILKSLSLTIGKGEKVGIVGHSGAGKSTLVGLILGFYEPTSGTILINDKNTLAHDPSFIRSISSFVPQDTNLFNRTVRENVMYARPNATDADLTAALKQAQAYEFVMKLSDGLDTVIGERGVKLSGGQRQRLAIARAILQDAPLLLLDEATSALDSVSEQAIQKALHELMKGRTSIVVAHRLSTLKHLDKIVVLDKGACVEQGTHDELIAQNGIYADLWARQKDGFIVD
jgi:ATP-binding cassette subfamily B protein